MSHTHIYIYIYTHTYTISTNSYNIYNIYYRDFCLFFNRNVFSFNNTILFYSGEKEFLLTEISSFCYYEMTMHYQIEIILQCVKTQKG